MFRANAPLPKKTYLPGDRHQDSLVAANPYQRKTERNTQHHSAGYPTQYTYLAVALQFHSYTETADRHHSSLDADTMRCWRFGRATADTGCIAIQAY